MSKYLLFIAVVFLLFGCEAKKVEKKVETAQTEKKQTLPKEKEIAKAPEKQEIASKVEEKPEPIKHFTSNPLKQGDKGEEVKLLQQYLNKFGYKLKEDGFFGYYTTQAMKHFQKSNGLKETEILNEVTVSKLETATPTNLAKDYKPPTQVIVNSSNDDFYQYKSATLDIKVEAITKPGLRYWISTIKVKNMSQVKSAFAGKDNKFTLNVKEPTSVIAQRYGAVFAVNGAAAGFNSKSYVIRDGIIYRGTTLDCAPLEFKKNGTLFIGEYGKRSAKQMVNEGTIHTYDFGPDLIINGKVAEYQSMAWFHNGYAPRTAVGQRTPYEYIIVVADGRSKTSRGMSFMDLVKVFQSRGVKWAYNIDGGGSTTLYYKNKVLNTPSDGRERNISDILYFTN